MKIPLSSLASQNLSKKLRVAVSSVDDMYFSNNDCCVFINSPSCKQRADFGLSAIDTNRLADVISITIKTCHFWS